MKHSCLWNSTKNGEKQVQRSESLANSGSTTSKRWGSLFVPSTARDGSSAASTVPFSLQPSAFSLHLPVLPPSASVLPLLILLFLAFSFIQADAASLTFDPPSKLKSDTLDCGESIALSIGDLDGDGRQDLVVGDEDGAVWCYKNSGTNELPIFTNREQLTTPAGNLMVAGYATPHIVYWDDNRLPDLLIGDELGNVRLFIWSGYPQFKEGILLKDNSGDITVDNYSSPCLADYNDDGKPDLLVGNGTGDVWCYPGMNASSPIFGTGTRLQAMKSGTMTEMNVGGRAAPIFYDWNEDGLKDMVVGDEYGYINYFRNTGAKEKPAFGTVSSRIKANNQDIDAGWESKPIIMGKDLLIADKTGQITLFRNTGSGGSPVLSSVGKIQVEEGVLDAGGFSAPAVVDWNNDGLKDLIVGDELGNIAVYLSFGLETNGPVFGAEFKIQTTGTATGGNLNVGNNAMPFIVDWNEDRNKDILVGDKYGKVSVYLNSSKGSEPAFGSPTTLQRAIINMVWDSKAKKYVGTQTLEDLDLGENAAVYAVDWNNDLTMDLVAGNSVGDVGVYLNSKSNQQPVFATYTPLTANGININIRGYAVPVVCHWNNDGRKDLLVGSGDGMIYLYLNQGTDAAPVFSNPYIISDVNGNVIDVGDNAAPILVDWDNDGNNDLLIGNSMGEILLSIGGKTNQPPGVTVITPTGTQCMNVSVSYVLRDTDSDSINIEAKYSVDGGLNWKNATPAGMGGDGQAGLFSTPNGTGHVFVWDASSDLGESKPFYRVKFCITPSDTEEGTPAFTNDFTVDNITRPRKGRITVNGATLDVGGYARPFVVDWNNDHRKDLLVGNNLGEVYFLQNIGSDEEPIFSAAVRLSCGAELLDVGYYAAPVAVFDWDNDGLKDLIVGDEYGAVSYFKNIGTDDSPSFAEVEMVGNGTRSTIDVAGYSTPFVCDWNNDGKKDLLVGSSHGGIEIFINTGADNNPAFGSSTRVLIGTKTELNLGNNSTVFVDDWNGNHKKDLICGSVDGRVYRVLNYGTSTPLFYKPTAITLDNEIVDVGAYSAPVVADWNNDGVKDLLVGNEEGQVMLHLLSTSTVNTPPRVGIKSPEGTQVGSVSIAYTLGDDQGDTCSVVVEYSTGGQWKTASGANTEGITASPDGESHEFVWLSDNDLPATNTQVQLRFTPNDGIANGSLSQISVTLHNLNAYPEVAELRVGTDSGRVGITFGVRDDDGDKVSIGVEYRSAGGVWTKASVVGTTSGLLSGAAASIIWLSTVDEPNKSGVYQLRLTPSDYKGNGTPTVSPEFSLSQVNLSAKLIKKGETPTLTFSPTRLAVQKPFDVDVLAAVELSDKGLPQMETYPQLDNTIRRLTIKDAASGEPIVSLQATLTIPYGTMTDYATEQYLQLYQLQEDRWVGIGGSVDVNNNEVSQTIKSAGVYRIGLSIPVNASLKAWVAPNPFKPNDGRQETGVDRVVFGNLKSGSRVKIYTISGELVRESGIIDDGSCQWPWYAKNEDDEDVGSGIYIYVISCGNEAAVIGKLAVIR